MEIEELMDKPVIGSQAQILGRVCGVEFDPNTWKIIEIGIELEKSVIETMGFQKPRVMGNVKVSIPVEEVSAISDVISLKKGAVELRGIAKKI